MKPVTPDNENHDIEEHFSKVLQTLYNKTVLHHLRFPTCNEHYVISKEVLNKLKKILNNFDEYDDVDKNPISESIGENLIILRDGNVKKDDVCFKCGKKAFKSICLNVFNAVLFHTTQQ